ncbi:MAG: hypothetical protein ACI83B_000205 [Sediminicola sp.]|jgi:hypothetical protein
MVWKIILDSSIHVNGFGTKIHELTKQNKNGLNGWVIDHSNERKSNGKLYIPPLNFYLKYGFKKLSRNRLELDKISAVKIKRKK